MFKKRKPDPPAGLPIWLQTYGDMVTLVLTFFIALYAMSTLDKQKYSQMSTSLRGAFSGQSATGIFKGNGKAIINPGLSPITSGESGTTPITGEPSMNAMQTKAWKEMYQSLKAVVERGNFKGRAEISYEEREITISFKEKLFFQIGSADILSEAFSTLNEVGVIINKGIYPIRIEGHTCDLPINNSKYPSNWELSVMRAVNVAKYFIEKVRMSPARIAVAGYGPYKPIVPNINDENRARNRRVDIIIINNFYRN